MWADRANDGNDASFFLLRTTRYRCARVRDPSKCVTGDAQQQ